jgi:uncharacterized protein
MNIHLVIETLLYAPILFFFLGVISNLVKSDLVIPEPLPKLFSMYLLMAIGLNAGYEIFLNGLSYDVVEFTLFSVFVTVASTMLLFFFFKKKFPLKEAAKMSSVIGTIFVISLIAIMTHFGKYSNFHGGIMVAILPLMEGIVLILGIFFSKIIENKSQGYKKFTLRKTILNGSILLLIGSMFIGFVIGEKGHKDMLLWEGIFKGMLAFFFLDAGIKIAIRIREIRKSLKETALSTLPC